MSTCRALLPLAALLLLAGCGPSPTPSASAPAGSPPSASSPAVTPGASGGAPTPPAAAASVEAHGWKETVTRSADGSTLLVAVTVTGPVTVQGGCLPEVQAFVADSSGQRLPNPADSGVHCLAISVEPVAAGESRTFATSVPTPRAAGTYTVHAMVHVEDGSDGAMPPVTISV